MKPLRTAIYARCSTADQHAEGQLPELRDYVAARGWTLAGEYVDVAQSGAKASRPALDQLMAAARARKIDCIVVVKIDRWARSMAHFVASVQELAELGVRFVATSQNIDTDQSSPTARLLLNLLAAFAEFERELIRERTRAGLAHARACGKTPGRKRILLPGQRIEDLRARGASYRDIGRELGLSLGVVQRYFREHPGCPAGPS